MTGFVLVSFVDPEDKLTVGTPWLLASIMLNAVAVTVSPLLIAPLLSRAGRHLADGTTADAGVYGRIARSSGLVTLLLVPSSCSWSSVHDAVEAGIMRDFALTVVSFVMGM